MTNDEPGVTSRELATVHQLPVTPVVDAELVSEDEWRRIQQRKVALQRRQDYRRDVTAVATVTRMVVTHPASRGAARHAYYVAAGAWTVSKRRHARRTLPDRMARAAETVGDLDKAEKWFQLGEASRAARHKRRMDWLDFPLRAARALAIGVVVWTITLILVGIIVATNSGDITRAFDPLMAFVTFIGWLWWLVTVGWLFALLTALAVTVLVLWNVGRTADTVPRFLAPAGRPDDTITTARVVLAVRELGIAALRKAIIDMGGETGHMLSPIVISGCGIEVDVTLPPGVTTEEVIRRRRKLAENLGRHEHEVFPTVAPQPRTVRVWAADSGALDEPIGPSPLTYDDTLRGDYKRGSCPWGQNLRGDAVTISLYQRHVLIAGISNQGKSRALIALALWLALDKQVELRVADLKGAGDWAPFAEIATALIEGPADEHVIAATEMLEDGVREMERRLRTSGSWHPLVLIVDEAQAAFMCPAKDPAGQPYGGSKNTSRYLTAVRKIQNQGRAVDVLLWQGTQNPTNQNLPVLAREGAHLRISTCVGTEEQSRMALGDKAVDGGAAPHLLRAGLDKGAVVVAGDGAPLSQGQASVTIRTHFIGPDDARQVAARAKALRGPVQQLDRDEPRDLLDDVYELMGDAERERASELAVLLRKVAPGYRPYIGLDGVRLAELLAERGVPVRVHKGFPKVAVVDVLRALDERVSDR